MEAPTPAQLAARLVDARERARLTQQQVADSLGLPRTAITQVENGNRQVNSLELLRMSVLYGIDLRDLIHGSDPNGETLAFFRKSAGSSDLRVEAAIKEVLPFCNLAAEIEDIIEANDPASRPVPILRYPSAALPGTPTRQGHQLARLERERLGLGFGPIADMSLLVRKYGIIVAEHTLPEGLSGVFLNTRNGRAFIILRSEERYGRRRFSLAHELCHALLDSHERVIISRTGDDRDQERRADAFASAFLLPREALVEYTAAKKLQPAKFDFTNVADLSVRYGLSYEATLVALEQFGLLGPGQRQELAPRAKQAAGYASTQHGYREPQFNRLSLKEWTFQRMVHAYERGVLTRKRAVRIATRLGYGAEVVASSLEMLKAGR